MTKIGVFDSGVGGQAVVDAIKRSIPDADVVYADDKANVPYGNKTPEELKQLVLPILNMLSKQGCDAIVVACNSVTTTIISDLRQKISTPLIGMEPMVKPAAATTETGMIAVCATPATLKSTRYAWLKQQYADGVEVLEPDCSAWPYMIESKQIDHNKIRSRIADVCEAGADVIVLGCTHYHWIEKEIKDIAKEYKTTVIQPEQPVIAQLKRVLGLRP
ncbi:MAG: glutamate racemase [Candidatus Saccharibacteria bacterium]|nr:glutamate racemase [Candidatus Saccharibacteria bacterium]